MTLKTLVLRGIASVLRLQLPQGQWYKLGRLQRHNHLHLRRRYTTQYGEVQVRHRRLPLFQRYKAQMEEWLIEHLNSTRCRHLLRLHGRSDLLRPRPTTRDELCPDKQPLLHHLLRDPTMV